MPGGAIGRQSASGVLPSGPFRTCGPCRPPSSPCTAASRAEGPRPKPSTTPHPHACVSCGARLKRLASSSSRHSLCCLGFCFLRPGETATIRPCDVVQAVLTFFRSKPKQQGWHRRPLAKYPCVWARWLYDYAVAHGLPWHAPFVEAVSVVLERALVDLLKGFRWKGLAWHYFR